MYFFIKTDKKENIVLFKAISIMKGFSQRKGNDYDEAYAPMIGWIHGDLASEHSTKVARIFL